ncbi:MAG: TIGR03118 family protein [Chitinophagaceae bacterium]
MKKLSHKPLSASFAVALMLFVLLFSPGCKKTIQPASEPEELISAPFKEPKQLKDFQQVNLVGNNNEYNPARIEPNMVNAWGIAFSPGGTAWVNATNTGLSFLFNSAGVPPRVPVAIPSPGGPTGGLPTGIVFNGSSDFKIPNGNPGRFIFVGVDGIVSGWNTGNFAAKMVDSSSTSAYTGLAIGVSGGANYLYAANFRTGRVDVFDKDYKSVTTMPFHDPNLPAGYAPFNIQNVEGKLYVMYAKVGPDGRDVAHPGFGYVDIYTTGGTLERRFISNGQLNAPWGVAKAPPGFFGEDGMTGVVLVGNFGDGRINAFDSDGRFLGQLRKSGQPIVIEGLWAITFPPGAPSTINPNWLFFAAGPDDEQEGLFGYITK